MMQPYYEDTASGITIYQGRAEDVLQSLPDGAAAMVLSDPPYGKTANEWDRIPDWTWLWPTLRRVSRPNAAMLLFGQDDFTAEMILSNRREYRYSLVWECDRVGGFLNAQHRPLRSHQDIAMFFRAVPTYNPLLWHGEAQHSRGSAPSRRQTSNYRQHKDVTTGTGNTEKHPRTVLYFPKPHPCVHPTEKPVALYEYLLRTYTDPGDLVIDCYAGSGPIVAAALRSGRRCIAIEGEERYCAIAANRLRQAVLPLTAAD